MNPTSNDPSVRAFGERARAVFAEAEPRRREILDAQAGDEFPEILWQTAARAGLLGALVPRRFGGDERGLLAAALGFEEMGASGLASAFPVLTVLAAQSILDGGHERVRESLLPRIAAGAIKIALGVTEEKAGFNTFAIETSARRDGDDYVLDGSKNYLSGADLAGFLLVVARTRTLAEVRAAGLPKTVGLSVFLVDAEAPGIRRERLPVRGEGAVRPNLVTFDGVRVPVEHRIGDEDAGALVLLRALAVERILMSAVALGMVRFCLDVACRHARERRVFGDRAIGSYQAIQHPLADAHVRAEAVRLLVHRAAGRFDAGEDPTDLEFDANAAKYLVSELGTKAVDAAIEALGGRGFDERVGVIQLWESMRLLRTSPISNELILNRVAQQQLALPRSY